MKVSLEFLVVQWILIMRHCISHLYKFLLAWVHLWEVLIHSLAELTNVDQTGVVASHELLQLPGKLFHLRLRWFCDCRKSLPSLSFVHHWPLMLIPWILIIATTPAISRWILVVSTVWVSIICILISIWVVALADLCIFISYGVIHEVDCIHKVLGVVFVILQQEGVINLLDIELLEYANKSRDGELVTIRVIHGVREESVLKVFILSKWLHHINFEVFELLAISLNILNDLLCWQERCLWLPSDLSPKIG